MIDDPIVRIAARGDGVTAAGRHFALAAPGDIVGEDKVVIPGPHHQVPPCRHFPECGGCQLQHVDDEAYANFVADRITGALAQHELETEVRPAHLSPPRSRRRASLKAMRAGRGVVIGFNTTSSHQIIDMRECHILRLELFALVAPLRELLGVLLGKRGAGEVQMSLCDQGVDLALKGVAAEGLAAAEALPAFAKRYRLARLSVDEGYGFETRFEPQPATVTLSGVPVGFPSGAFLQATQDGEALLAEAVREATAGAARSFDLFSGLGTFTLAMDGAVTAAEASRDAVLALTLAAKRTGRSIDVQHRDLYRRPFQPDELAAADATVLDPPRAGAQEQVRALAASTVQRIAYVSCNPATFARDARVLVDGGYRLNWIQPVGQFRWSTHVELAAAFSR